MAKTYTRVTVETVSDIDDNEPIEAVRDFVDRIGKLAQTSKKPKVHHRCDIPSVDKMDVKLLGAEEPCMCDCDLEYEVRRPKVHHRHALPSVDKMAVKLLGAEEPFVCDCDNLIYNFQDPMDDEDDD